MYTYDFEETYFNIIFIKVRVLTCACISEVSDVSNTVGSMYGTHELTELRINLYTKTDDWITHDY